MALTLQDIEQLFAERGHRSDGESVSHLRHAHRPPRWPSATTPAPN